MASYLAKKAPASLLDALEQHLASLEGKKPGQVTTPTGAAKPASFTSALNTMSSNHFNVSEAEKKKILDEENLYLQKLKTSDDMFGGEEESAGESMFDQKAKEAGSPQAAVNPFNAPSPSNGAQANLFGSPTQPNAAGAASARPSDDLLALGGNLGGGGNPFMDNVQSAMASAYSAPAPAANNPFGAPSFQANGYNQPAAPANPSGFSSEADFAKAFSNGGTNTTGFDAFGDVLQPMGTASPSHSGGPSQAHGLGKDLDTSLATLATGLTVGGGASQMKKDHQWQPKGDPKLTGGMAFQRAPLAQSTTPQWGNQGFQQQPQMPMAAAPQPMMYAQPMGMPMAQPMMGQQPMMGMPQQAMVPPGAYGMQPRMPMAGGFPQQGQGQQVNNSNVNDPFGAL